MFTSPTWTSMKNLGASKLLKKRCKGESIAEIFYKIRTYRGRPETTLYLYTVVYYQMFLKTVLLRFSWILFPQW